MKKPDRRTRHVYACTLCTCAYHHPLNYCPQCPGRLVRRDLPWDDKKYPKGYFEGLDAGEKYKKWLAAHGLKLAW